MVVLECLDQWREQNLRYRQKVASRRRFEARFQSLARQIFDAAFDCQISKEGAGMELALAKALLPLAGFSEADRVHHEGWKQLIHPEDHPVIAAHIQHVLSGQHDVCVFRVITRTGAVGWFSVLTSPVWDEAGRRVAHVYGQVRDHCPEGAAALPRSSSDSAQGVHHPPAVAPEEWDEAA